MAATYKSKISFQIKRFKEFWKTFKHSKRGLFGIGILIFYTLIALSAPLLTPNDPIYGYYVAGDFAAPSWFRQLPGGEKLTENFELVVEPGFPSSSSLFNEWNFATTSPDQVTLQYHPNVGEGSAAIVFRRKDVRELSGMVEATLFKEFPFHHDPPTRFTCSLRVLVEGAEDIPIRVSTIIKQVGESQSSTIPIFWSEKFDNTITEWVNPTIDSYETSFRLKFGDITADPARVVFSTPANYAYHIQIFFEDVKPDTLGKEVLAIVYIDNLNVKLYGTAYGLLGTDHVGRDIFAQLVYGARISLFVGLLAALLSVVIGLFVGLVSGYIGKYVDQILMRFTDMLLVLPSLPLLIVLIAVIGPSIWNLIMVIALLGWMGFARQVRSQTLSLKERPFVEAAKAVGSSRSHIIMKHILPNVISLTYVALALSVPGAILSEAALSWLGLFDPIVVSWGKMLYDAQWNEGIYRWWWIVPPGISIAALSLSFVLIGYALDEILNPKLRRRR